MNLDFLDTYNDYTLGPIQAEEALFLYGLCRMVRPQRLIEFGSLIGQSLRVWVNAEVPEIHCVDVRISKQVQRIAGDNQHLRIHLYEQDMKQPLPLSEIDFIFVDASHVMEDNIQVVKNYIDVLRPGGMIAFHDTGHWAQKDVTTERWGFINSFDGHWDTNLNAWVHHPGEKATVKWVSENTDLQRLDFWTTETGRYGVTIFQKPN